MVISILKVVATRTVECFTLVSEKCKFYLQKDESSDSWLTDKEFNDWLAHREAKRRNVMYVSKIFGDGWKEKEFDDWITLHSTKRRSNEDYHKMFGICPDTFGLEYTKGPDEHAFSKRKYSDANAVNLIHIERTFISKVIKMDHLFNRALYCRDLEKLAAYDADDVPITHGGEDRKVTEMQVLRGKCQLVNWLEKFEFFWYQKKVYKKIQNDEYGEIKCVQCNYTYSRYAGRKAHNINPVIKLTFGAFEDMKDRELVSKMINVKAAMSVRINVFEQKQEYAARVYRLFQDMAQERNQFEEHRFLILFTLGGRSLGPSIEENFNKLAETRQRLNDYDEIISASKRRIEGIDRCLERYRVMKKNYDDGIKVLSKILSYNIIELIFAFYASRTELTASERTELDVRADRIEFEFIESEGRTKFEFRDE